MQPEFNFEELIAGLAAMMDEKTAAFKDNFTQLALRIVDLEAKVVSFDAMIAPPVSTGLPDPNTLQYMVLDFFDNSEAMARGKGKYVLKITGNKMRKPGNMKPDYSLTAYMFEYAKFMKSFKATELDERDAAIKRIGGLKDQDNMLFGLVRSQGGKQGTAVFGDQLIILRTDGATLKPKIVEGALFIGSAQYAVPAVRWEYVDSNLRPFKVATLTSKARCWPLDGGDEDVE